MEEDLLARVRGDAGLTTLIATRSSWGLLKQGATLPALTLLIVSLGRDYVHSGGSALEHPRVQVDSYGATMLEALQVARAFATMIEPTAVQGSTQFVRAFLVGHEDGSEIVGGATRHRARRDYIIWHRPS
jgi:hypothetical protein